MLSRRVLFVAALLCAFTSSAMEPVQVAGTSWSFEAINWNGKASAKKVGKVKASDTPDVTFDLGESGAWSGSLDFPFLPPVPLSGTYTRKNDFARKLQVEFDAKTTQALADEQEDNLEAFLAANGFDGTVDIALASQKNRLAIKIKKKIGMAFARLKSSLRFQGTTSIVGGPTDAPSKVRNTLKGKSEMTPFPQT